MKDGSAVLHGFQHTTTTRRNHVCEMTRLYLAGKMSGCPDYNFPGFTADAAALRTAGYEVVNPAELSLALSPDLSAPKTDYMREDIRALIDCDGIALRSDWLDSGQISLIEEEDLDWIEAVS